MKLIFCYVGNRCVFLFNKALLKHTSLVKQLFHPKSTEEKRNCDEKKEVRKSTKKGENVLIRQLPFTDTISANVYILCSALPIRYTWFPKPCHWFIYCHIESLVDQFCFLESPFSAFMTFFLCFNMCPKSTGNPGMYVSMQRMRKYLYQAPT